MNADLILIFTLNLLTQALAQLKYSFASKDRGFAMYVIVGIDTILYLYSLQLVLSKKSIVAIIVLTIGKLLGITLANYIESLTVKKTYSYQFYFNDFNVVQDLEDELTKNNMSVTVVKGFFKNEERFILSTHVNPKQADYIFNYLESKWKISEPTADCVEVRKTFGNIRKRVHY